MEAQAGVLQQGQDWDVRSLLGKGAFGEVYLAYKRSSQASSDGATQKSYVLKRIKLARQSAWQREATLREIRLMAALNHPFIVPFVESWTHHGHTVNVVLGHCEQGDLGTIITKRKGKLFDEGTLRRWLAQLLLALEYLGRQHVLHRDIKTSNVFLCTGGHVQLGDFGLASVRDANDAASLHDQSLVGTPHFMSPELLGNRGYSHQTDMWSLGCVMYELTALKPAFNAFNLDGLVKKIKASGPAPLPAGFSAEWNAIIRSMLVKDPSRRPTVEQMMAVQGLMPAVAEARRLARTMQPDIVLPPMPTSTYTLPVAPGSTQAPTTSDSAGGARDSGTGKGKTQGFDASECSSQGIAPATLKRAGAALADADVQPKQDVTKATSVNKRVHVTAAHPLMNVQQMAGSQNSAGVGKQEEVEDVTEEGTGESAGPDPALRASQDVAALGGNSSSRGVNALVQALAAQQQQQQQPHMRNQPQQGINHAKLLRQGDACSAAKPKLLKAGAAAAAGRAAGAPGVAKNHGRAVLKDAVAVSEAAAGGHASLPYHKLLLSKQQAQQQKQHQHDSAAQQQGAPEKPTTLCPTASSASAVTGMTLDITEGSANSKHASGAVSRLGIAPADQHGRLLQAQDVGAQLSQAPVQVSQASAAAGHLVDQQAAVTEATQQPLFSVTKEHHQQQPCGVGVSAAPSNETPLSPIHAFPDLSQLDAMEVDTPSPVVVNSNLKHKQEGESPAAAPPPPPPASANQQAAPIPGPPPAPALPPKPAGEASMRPAGVRVAAQSPRHAPAFAVLLPAMRTSAASAGAGSDNNNTAAAGGAAAGGDVGEAGMRKVLLRQGITGTTAAGLPKGRTRSVSAPGTRPSHGGPTDAGVSGVPTGGLSNNNPGARMQGVAIPRGWNVPVRAGPSKMELARRHFSALTRQGAAVHHSHHQQHAGAAGAAGAAGVVPTDTAAEVEPTAGVTGVEMCGAGAAAGPQLGHGQEGDAGDAAGQGDGMQATETGDGDGASWVVPHVIPPRRRWTAPDQPLSARSLLAQPPSQSQDTATDNHSQGQEQATPEVQPGLEVSSQGAAGPQDITGAAPTRSHKHVVGQPHSVHPAALAVATVAEQASTASPRGGNGDAANAASSPSSNSKVPKATNAGLPQGIAARVQKQQSNKASGLLGKGPKAPGGAGSIVKPGSLGANAAGAAGGGAGVSGVNGTAGAVSSLRRMRSALSSRVKAALVGTWGANGAAPTAAAATAKVAGGKAGVHQNGPTAVVGKAAAAAKDASKADAAPDAEVPPPTSATFPSPAVRAPAASAQPLSSPLLSQSIKSAGAGFTGNAAASPVVSHPLLQAAGGLASGTASPVLPEAHPVVPEDGRVLQAVLQAHPVVMQDWGEAGGEGSEPEPVNHQSQTGSAQGNPTQVPQAGAKPLHTSLRHLMVASSPVVISEDISGGPASPGAGASSSTSAEGPTGDAPPVLVPGWGSPSPRRRSRLRETQESVASEALSLPRQSEGGFAHVYGGVEEEREGGEGGTPGTHFVGVPLPPGWSQDPEEGGGSRSPALLSTGGAPVLLGPKAVPVPAAAPWPGTTPVSGGTYAVPALSAGRASSATGPQIIVPDSGDERATASKANVQKLAGLGSSNTRDLASSFSFASGMLEGGNEGEEEGEVGDGVVVALANYPAPRLLQDGGKAHGKVVTAAVTLPAQSGHTFSTAVTLDGRERARLELLETVVATAASLMQALRYDEARVLLMRAHDPEYCSAVHSKDIVGGNTHTSSSPRAASAAVPAGWHATARRA